jgi:hypothetical protein
MGMASTTDVVVEASVKALEFCEAAWKADMRGRRCPDVTGLSDTALLSILHYGEADLPSAASEAAQAEARHRGLLASVVDRWMPWAVMGGLVGSGLAITVELLVG